MKNSAFEVGCKVRKAAVVGDILEVEFPRPRDRKAMMEHPDYYSLREQLIEFFEVHAHRHKEAALAPAVIAPPCPQISLAAAD